MKNEILIEKDKRFTLPEYVPLASHVMSLIAAVADGVDEINETFSISDLRRVLDNMSERMEGEFEFLETDSEHYQVTYEPYDDIDEADFDGEYMLVRPVEGLDDKKNNVWVSGKILEAFREGKFNGIAIALYFQLGFTMHSDEAIAVSHHIEFEKILESCKEHTEYFNAQHRTAIMRAMANLEDAGLVEWNSKARAFKILHITPYDPTRKV